MRLPRLLHLLAKEFRELMASRAFWLLLLMIGPLVGHSFITAVDTYAEATGISGGLIRVSGAVGDFLGAAIPGDQRGMRGGTVLVGGDAGDRVGDRMRRGLVLIEGRAGDYCASRMLAGTIAVWGPVGRFPGMAMKRGTLLLRQAPALLPTFTDSGRQSLGFLSLLVRSWRTLPGRFATIADSQAQVQRYMGDLANDGRGEILVWPWGN